MAAVWAAGPEPIITTLLCILLLPMAWISLRYGAVPLLESVAAAAMERPLVPARRVRLKYEENSLAA
jgi:hypothetical protein